VVGIIFSLVTISKDKEWKYQYISPFSGHERLMIGILIASCIVTVVGLITLVDRNNRLWKNRLWKEHKIVCIVTASLCALFGGLLLGGISIENVAVVLIIVLVVIVDLFIRKKRRKK